MMKKLLVLSLCAVALAACGGEDAGKAPAKVESEAPTEEVEESKQESVEYTIGDTVEIDGLTFTLNDAKFVDERFPEANTEVEVGDEDKILTIFFEVKNESEENYFVGEDGSYSVYADGKKAKDYYLNSSMADEVSPGHSIGGELSFVIPGDTKEIDVEWQPHYEKDGEWVRGDRFTFVLDARGVE